MLSNDSNNSDEVKKGIEMEEPNWKEFKEKEVEKDVEKEEIEEESMDVMEIQRIIEEELEWKGKKEMKHQGRKGKKRISNLKNKI